ncbi:D-malate degradation protein R [Serratia entomophila]|uniref:LysR family transcriptional regulator n=1 Tax=Serratia entomophila TaxID=42906 RepID=A0ABY5CZR7_9GAMM|nr:LysR family transcriptional regulator [Serratia entomophila]UIW20620.1 LysR family transcriptional regulator [Serratia entomophila]USV03127.1 LysR family transcriptional regulator [Serratia entomophila]CAI0716231.1 D-malate degradation protein R [Serratia entomophila]CAI0807606.1 D-malate degradation protein R [Serratia entomophila]CAI0807664.1 D-malate degradation protein R [Serratia entomophila]
MNKIKLPNGDRITLLQTLVRIVDSGSLSAAALQLNTTQPTVSRRLQTLEQLLGVKLIQRTTHAIKLTDDGERCHQHARRLLEHWQIMEDEVRGARDEPVGVLRVRAPHAFGQDQLIGPLGEYLQRYRQTSVEWTLNDHSPDFIPEGIDCAIHVGSVTDPSVVAVLLAEVPRSLVASPALLAQRPTIATLGDLAQLPWLALNSFYRNEVTLTHRESGEVQRIDIAPRLSTDSLYAVRKAALDGLGVAIVSSWVVREELAQGRLHTLLPQWQAAPLPIYLLYPYASYYPARLRKFMELMKEVMPRILGTRAPAGR